MPVTARASEIRQYADIDAVYERKLTSTSETEELVDLLVRARGTPRWEAELLVRVLLPAEGL